MILITLLFSFLRPHHSVVYAPKTRHADDKHAPPPIGNGLFAWFIPVAKTREAELVEKVGLDGTVFLRFTRMCRNMFLIMSVIGCAIIIPANILGSNKSLDPASAWASMTPQAVEGQALWAHVVCSWLFDTIVVFFLWQNYRAVTRLRRQYFESSEYQNSLHSRTLMLTDIPGPARSDEGIYGIVDSIEQTSGVPRAAIGRNVKELPGLIEQHEKTVRALESILAKFLKNPDRLPKRPTLRASRNDRRGNAGRRVDAIDYLTGRIHDLEDEIRHVRDSIDKRNPMPYGFASYNRIEEAHTVAYAARKKHPKGITLKLAPRPNDLIWKNLPLSKSSRKWKQLTNNFWVAILTLIWTAPNAMIAIFLSNLSHLAAIWPAFQTTYDGKPKIWAAVQGIASPALTSLVYLILPIIFRRLSIRAGDLTKTSRERHVTHKLYAFFVFNNLIVFSVFSAIWTFVSAVISNRHKNLDVWDSIKKAGFFFQIMYGLCNVSPFWVTWLLQRNLGSAADLSQIINLTWIWFANTFMNPTPRQHIEWTAPPAFDYATYYNYFLFYATVALCFSTIQPLVLPVTALFFVVDAWLKKYLILYVFITKTESGGQFWRILYNRFVFATILANVVTALVIKANGSWTMLGVMAPLPILMLAFKWYCAKTFDDQCKYYTKVILKDSEALPEPGKKQYNDRLARKFGHPALYKPLMTPMVHAKAQHVLAQFYRGRVEPDGASVAGYSDIAMDSMSQTRPGKSARFAPTTGNRDTFDFVPETQLDFAFYKNKPEFSDEHGGDGELYGRPTDLISERSQTPRSFLEHGGDSNGSSRASSPGHEFRFAGQRTQSGLHHTTEDDLAFPPRQGPASQGQRGGYGDMGDGGLGMYNLSNESERRLLSGAQPVGFVHDGGIGEREEEDSGAPLGLERWRTGGTDYRGVSGREASELGYDAYRRGG